MKDLILLHGALHDEKQFDGLHSLLSDDFRIHTMNFEGHGSRGTERDFNIKNFCRNILGFAEEKGLEDLNLFGYSMGGYAALLLAAEEAKKVGKVYTLATKIKWSPEIAAKETGLLNPEKMQEKIPAFAASLETKHTALGWKRVVEETAQLLTDLGRNNYLDEKTLSAIICPMHISIGEKDHAVTLEECQWAAGIIKDAEVEIIPDTPHPFEKVDLSLLAQSIKAFF